MTAVVPANLEPIFKTANITQVYANGGKAHEICEKYLKKFKRNGQIARQITLDYPGKCKF